MSVNKDTSLLRGLVETYMVAQGFHRTFKTNPQDPTRALPDTWGHAELGEGRTFMQCVGWQMGREAERHLKDQP